MVGGPKDNTVFFFRAMARPNGLQDATTISSSPGASSARYAALKSGAVDASILTDPFDNQAELEGYKKVDALVPKYVERRQLWLHHPRGPARLGQGPPGRAHALYARSAQGCGLDLRPRQQAGAVQHRWTQE